MLATSTSRIKSPQKRTARSSHFASSSWKCRAAGFSVRVGVTEGLAICKQVRRVPDCQPFAFQMRDRVRFGSLSAFAEAFLALPSSIRISFLQTGQILRARMICSINDETTTLARQ